MSERALSESRHDLPTPRRRGPVTSVRGRLVLGLVVVLAAALAGWYVLDRYGPATVSIRGTWSLQQVTKDGRLVVTSEDLSGLKVQAQFDDNGNYTIWRGCGATTGSYRVSFGKLRFGQEVTTADACGYTTASAEQLATAISTAIDHVFSDQPSRVSRPSVNQLQVEVSGYEIHYRRA